MRVRKGDREEHSMDQCRSRLKLSENFERHWSIPISGEIHMDQSLVHTFSWGNSYGPMVLKVLQKFPPTLVLVHGWLFPGRNGELSSRTPNQPKRLQDNGRPNNSTIGLIAGIGFKLDRNDYRTGERNAKGQLVPFSRGHGYMGGGGGLNILLRGRNACRGLESGPLRFEGKMSNSDATNTLKLGKPRKGLSWFHFDTRTPLPCRPGPHAPPWACENRYHLSFWLFSPVL